MLARLAFARLFASAIFLAISGSRPGGRFISGSVLTGGMGAADVGREGRDAGRIVADDGFGGIGMAGFRPILASLAAISARPLAMSSCHQYFSISTVASGSFSLPQC
jgi:hypothetical protein